jgi:hypothetical protein
MWWVVMCMGFVAEISVGIGWGHCGEGWGGSVEQLSSGHGVAAWERMVQVVWIS